MDHGIAPYLFYLFAFMIVVSGILVVTLRDIFHCALMLVICMFSVAAIYVLLGADFIAAVQVLIYVGAVSVLLIFAIMLTARVSGIGIKQQNEQVPFALLATIAFMAITVFGLGKTIWNVKSAAPPEETVMSLGKLLMTVYVVPFEIVSIVLLAALIGAIVIARRD
ncbi:MAG: NADH-quinone oxidoreductase subunit J [bacterium]|nr:NADH-quinone oxidoreductase subunit J [bacterium]